MRAPLSSTRAMLSAVKDSFSFARSLTVAVPLLVNARTFATKTPSLLAEHVNGQASELGRGSDKIYQSGACAAGTTYSDPPLEYKMITASNIKSILAERAPWLDADDFTAAAHVFPMRANNYVVDQLMKWENVPNDPIFRLVFPQPAMLAADQLERLKLALRYNQDGVVLRALAEQVRANLNPHPADQKTENVPKDTTDPSSAPLPGIQHKYRETVLFFPTEGQYCHSFCTYCFRWAQFTAVGSEQAFQSKDARRLVEYLARSRDVSDLLFTGGDPMVMKTRH